MKQMREILAIVAIAYVVGTAVIGYDQGRNYIGPLGPLADMIGPAYAENAIRQHSPDWETVSPTFWLGAERGMADATAVERANEHQAAVWVKAGYACPEGPPEC